MAQLFREEALEAQRDAFLGPVRIRSTLSASLAAGISMLLVGMLIGFMALAQYPRKTKVPGLLAPVLGSVHVSTPAPGVLLERRVSDGDVVKAGQPLFVVGTDRTTQAGDATRLIAESLATRMVLLRDERTAKELQSDTRIKSLSSRLGAMQSEMLSIDAEIELLSRRTALAAGIAERQRQLADEGFLADTHANQKQEEVLDLQGKAQLLARTRTSLMRDIESVRSDQLALSSQFRVDMAQLDRNRIALEQETIENNVRRNTIVTAPVPGSISAVLVSPGQALQAGQSLASLVPGAEGRPSQLEAQLFATSRAVGFVRAGQHVWLRYVAYPYQKFGMHHGEITHVSRTPISAQDLPNGQAQALQHAVQSSEPLYRITVKLSAQELIAHGESRVLKPGMSLEADIVHEHRGIWEWLFEPVISASRQIRIPSDVAH